MLQRNAPQKEPVKLKADILPSEKPALSAAEQISINFEFIDVFIKRFIHRNGVEDGDNTEEVMRLIRAGADIATTAMDNDKMTALHYAAEQRHTKTCALLIDEYAKAGGDVKSLITAKDVYGNTPLLHPIWGDFTQTAILLIRKYAEAGGSVRELLSIKNNGEAPLSDYAKGKFLKLIPFLPLFQWDMETVTPFFNSFEECVSSP